MIDKNKFISTLESQSKVLGIYFSQGEIALKSLNENEAIKRFHSVMLVPELPIGLRLKTVLITTFVKFCVDGLLERNEKLSDSVVAMYKQIRTTTEKRVGEAIIDDNAKAIIAGSKSDLYGAFKFKQGHGFIVYDGTVVLKMAI